MSRLVRSQNCGEFVAILTGDAFDAILRTAEMVSADLIVMGTHRKQLLRDIFVETTIERVIRTGPYPVLMVNTEVKILIRACSRQSTCRKHPRVRSSQRKLWN